MGARLTVAVFLVFTAFACASIPEMYEDVEPEFVEELVQEQAPTTQATTPQAPTVDQDKTNMNSQPDQLGDVETFKVGNQKLVTKELTRNKRSKRNNSSLCRRTSRTQMPS